MVMKPMLRFALTAVVIATGLCGARPCFADDPRSAAVSEEQRQQARELFTAGRKAMKEHRRAEALDKLKRAYAILPHFQVAAALGEVEVDSKLYRDAAEHLAFALTEPVGQAAQADRERREVLLHEAEDKVGKILLTADPQGAHLSIDDRPIGDAPLPTAVYVNPGTVVVGAALAGYVPYQGSITLSAGAHETVQIKLVPTQPLTPIAGKLSDLPPDPTPAPPPPVVDAKPAGKSSLALGLGFGGAGLGAATSVVAFVIFNSAVTSYHATFDQLVAAYPHNDACVRVPRPSGCDELQSAISRANTTQTIGWVGAGVGAALGVATLVYLLLPESKAAKASGFRVRPDPWGVGGQF
jgi:hypothetical protein